MSALLRIMVITLAFLACSQGHSMPVPRGEADNKADAINYGSCPPCVPGGQRPAHCRCPRNRIPQRWGPDFGQIGNYGSHGGRFYP